ncbi:MAG TPA: hypothetical protein VL442_07250 [Mucilaginibacter sp.]|jgi:hypothetical protein|nr:hypothetical protein [Mucilaginibacter sp.]
MKNINYLGLLLLVLVFSLSRSYGQQRQQEMPRQRMHSFYKKTLNIDSVKAEQVLQIMLNYKTGVTQTVNSQSLDVDTKSKSIKALMNDKNRQLEAILTKEQ